MFLVYLIQNVSLSLKNTTTVITKGINRISSWLTFRCLNYARSLYYKHHPPPPHRIIIKEHYTGRLHRYWKFRLITFIWLTTYFPWGVNELATIITHCYNSLLTKLQTFMRSRQVICKWYYMFWYYCWKFSTHT